MQRKTKRLSGGKARFLEEASSNWQNCDMFFAERVFGVLKTLQVMNQSTYNTTGYVTAPFPCWNNEVRFILSLVVSSDFHVFTLVEQRIGILTV